MNFIRKNYFKYQKHLAVLFLIVQIIACSGSGDGDEPDNSDVWDIDKVPVPKFVTMNYIELENIYRISKYRSSIGHDYSDYSEQCRSLKHYFEPAANADWSAIKIFAPVSGTLTRVEVEFAGTKLEIASDEYPAFRFSIFHVNLTTQYKIGDKVVVGEQLGTHIGSQTYSDISVIVNDVTRQGRMVSFFDVINDSVFSIYKARGVTHRDELIIAKELRDENPLTCNSGVFTSTDNLESWFFLN